MSPPASTVMACFGLETYEEVCQFAKELLADLRAKNSLDEMPADFFSVDYDQMCKAETERLIASKGADQLKALVQEASVQEYCKAQLRSQDRFTVKYLEQIIPLQKEYEKCKQSGTSCG